MQVIRPHPAPYGNHMDLSTINPKTYRLLETAEVCKELFKIGRKPSSVAFGIPVAIIHGVNNEEGLGNSQQAPGARCSLSQRKSIRRPELGTDVDKSLPLLIPLYDVSLHSFILRLCILAFFWRTYVGQNQVIRKKNTDRGVFFKSHFTNLAPKTQMFRNVFNDVDNRVQPEVNKNEPYGDLRDPADAMTAPSLGFPLLEATLKTFGNFSKRVYELGNFSKLVYDQMFEAKVPVSSGFGRKDVVEHLLQMGANVHARDDGGLIPLHNACSFGHAEVVSLLLCQGADPNARDNWNYTPLHEAAIKGKIDVCIVLLQHGADPNIRNTDGKSALDLADPSAKAVLTDKTKAFSMMSEELNDLDPASNRCGAFSLIVILDFSNAMDFEARIRMSGKIDRIQKLEEGIEDS
ncbi:hypothetical protein E2I00_010933 [Balaenoptera physalus]|uniref:Uncharacterized protein n=1 Tax=Balaenoptera physalus TaxID=9770 RepID=A0A6A1QNE9_BALPH|nr:hypothetical protein E2I00_010933 [Balaenoptera physalus]